MYLKRAVALGRRRNLVKLEEWKVVRTEDGAGNR
jgi:hypothetical protein